MGVAGVGVVGVSPPSSVTGDRGVSRAAAVPEGTALAAKELRGRQVTLPPSAEDPRGAA